MPPYLWRLFKSLYRELGWNYNHVEKLVEEKMMDNIDFFWFIAFPMVVLQEPFWSSKSFFGSMCSQLSLPAPNLGAHVLHYVAFLTMMHPGNGHQNHQHRYCKILQQKNSKACEQKNQSHPPSSSVQVISQKGCHFALAIWRVPPNLPIIFYLGYIKWQNYSNFDISYTVGLNIMETYLRGNGLVV